jgi:hypothetical protein
MRAAAQAWRNVDNLARRIAALLLKNGGFHIPAADGGCASGR